MKNLNELYNKGEHVLFTPDNAFYKIEEIEVDVLYLIDNDGSSFTATQDELCTK